MQLGCEMLWMLHAVLLHHLSLCICHLQWFKMRSSVRYAWILLWTVCFWSVATWSHVWHAASRWMNAPSVASMWSVWCAPSAFEDPLRTCVNQLLLTHCIDHRAACMIVSWLLVYLFPNDFNIVFVILIGDTTCISAAECICEDSESSSVPLPIELMYYN